MINIGMILSTILTGQWISPTITGSDVPLAISYFSLHLLTHSGNQAIMFGGFTVPEEENQQQYTDAAYTLTMTGGTVVSDYSVAYCIAENICEERNFAIYAFSGKHKL